MSGEMSRQRLEEILVECKQNSDHVLDIEKPRFENRPPISDKLWKNYDLDFQHELDFLVDYVNMGFIHDDFKDNKQRNEWKAELNEKYEGFSEAYTHFNALKFKKIDLISKYIADLFDNYIHKNKEDFTKNRTSIMEGITMYKGCSIHRHDYEALSFEQKHEYVKQVQTQVMKVLDFLDKSTPELQS